MAVPVVSAVECPLRKHLDREFRRTLAEYRSKVNTLLDIASIGDASARTQDLLAICVKAREAFLAHEREHGCYNRNGDHPLAIPAA